MAAKKNNVKTEIARPDYQAIKWVNRNLTDEEKTAHDATKIEPTAIFKDCLALAVGGYNFALKWDTYSSCFQATLIPYNTASPNFGYGLSARSAEPFRALSLLLFKHYSVLQEDWQIAYKPAVSSFEG